MSSSNPKDRHYWTQLRRALTEGNWKANNPACTPNGTIIPWAELFRKFNKHCRGFQDVAEIASQTQALGLFLTTKSKDEDQENVEGGQIYPLDLGAECLLPEERKGEAKGGYDTLLNIKAANLDSLHFALAFYAYALGDPAKCLAHLHDVPDISKIQQHIPAEADKHAATGTNSTHHTSLFGSGGSSSIAGGSFSGYADSSAPEIRDGRGWAATETVRSYCLQGMSHEKLTPSSPSVALASYAKAFPFLVTLTSTLSITSPPTTANGKLSLAYFTQYRELWRWVARLTWRAICLSSQMMDIRTDNSSGHVEGDPPSLWAWFGVYNKLSAYWPPTFRTSQRSTISALQLRAYILRYGASSDPVHPRTIMHENPEARCREWLHSARSAVNDYRAILNASTTFPRAGERNTKVEDFVDLCIGIWEASGSSGDSAGWLVDVLWWATRLTFNCPRIFRHMTRVFDAAGECRLATRTLRLYSQVVGKAFQAKHASDTPKDSTQENSKKAPADVEEEDEGEEDELIEEMDVDTDENWVETLAYGARMLCRYGSVAPGIEGIEDVRDAGTYLQKAKTRLPTKDAVLSKEAKIRWEKLRGLLSIAEGVHDCVLALKELDPRTRPRLLESAHSHFLRALQIQSQPTPATYYNLALSFARPTPCRNIDLAIEQAGKAVETDPNQIRYWHLLGLLLSAQGKWEAAKEILERGVAITDIGNDDMETQTISNVDGNESEPQTPTATNGPNGHSVVPKDFGGLNGFETATLRDKSYDATPTQSSVLPSLTVVLPPQATDIPAPSALLQPLPDRPVLAKVEVFERSLQIRMSLGALTEVMEGAEGAEVKWLEVFRWVAAWSGNTDGMSTRRTSVDEGSRREHDTEKSESVFAHSTNDQTISETIVSERHLSELPVENPDTPAGEKPLILRPSLIVSPATPTDASFQNIAGSDGSSSPEREKGSSKEKKKKDRRSSSASRDGEKEKVKDRSKGKKMQRILKNRVHQGQAKIHTMTRKVVRNGKNGYGGLRRSLSVPDFHDILKQTSYQASSIHSRRRLSSSQYSPQDTQSYFESSSPDHPTSPPPPPMTPLPDHVPNSRTHKPSTRMSALIADLWLMSAATFRRLGKIEQARGSIQEAEVRGEGRPGVWVQLGLYYMAHGKHHSAMAAFQKALFIEPDDVPATIHLARLHLESAETDPNSPSLRTYAVPASSTAPTAAPEEGKKHTVPPQVDLAAGMLSHLVRGAGWDVPEAWYYLAKAYARQGRKEQERESLKTALEVSNARSVRDIGQAVGWCL